MSNVNTLRVVYFPRIIVLSLPLALSTASLCSLLNASQTRIKIRIRSPFFKVR
ncbi:Uncharacterised protein [Shigella sonnei]|nr:Uncharacterised protein [Shigella sonnei]